MLIAEKFIHSIVEKYGKHTVYTDGGTWYHEACKVLGKTLFAFLSGEKFDGRNQPISISKIELNHLMTISLIICNFCIYAISA